jgi:hypothetical protein
VKVGEAVAFTARAADADAPAQAITYSLDAGSPAGASIDPATGVFAWTPPAAGAYRITVRATDSGTPALSATHTVTINVLPVNRGPGLAAIGNKQVDEQTRLTFTASATDPNGDRLTFSLLGAPAGAAIGPATGVFTWTPTADQGPGAFTFTVRVTDGGTPNLSDEEEITVTVGEVNRAPELDPISPKTFAELATRSFTVVARDPDSPANALIFSLVGPPAGAAIDPATGVFTWTPTEAQGPGTFEFAVRVTDAGSPGLFDEERVAITVLEVNAAPELNAVGNKRVAKDETLRFTATASDPDLPTNALTFSLVGAPDGAGINPLTGEFVWTPAGPGVYTFTVRVSDDGPVILADEEEITVTDEADNQPPTDIALGNARVAENSPTGSAVGSLTATDPDAGDSFSFALVGGVGAADNALFAIDGDLLRTAAAFDYEARPSYSVRVRATDVGGLWTERVFTISVTDVNEAPELTAIADRTVDEGSAATFTASGTDQDAGQSLTYSLVDSPAGASIDPVTGEFRWTPTDGPARTATFRVRVTDGGSPARSSEQPVTVTVRNVAPTVAVPPPANVLAGQAISAGGSFADPAGAADDGYTYRWRVLRGGDAVYDSGALATTFAGGVPGLADTPAGAGRYTVELTVTDKDGGQGSVARPVEVSPRVIAITRLDAQTTSAASVRFRVSFSDPVAGLAPSHFAALASGVSGAGVTAVADDGDGRSWTVTVSTGAGDGSVALRLTGTSGLTGPDGVAVADQALDGPAYTLDRTAPSVARFYVLYGNGQRYDLATAARLNLPWAITGVQVVFTEAVTASAASLALTGRYGPLAVSTFGGSGTDTLTWTLASPVTLDRLALALASAGANGVRDAAGNMIQSVATSFEVYVVLGDVSGDRRVLTGDRTQVRNSVLYALPYDPFLDVNGDGVVDNADLALVTGRVGTGLA